MIVNYRSIIDFFLFIPALLCLVKAAQYRRGGENIINKLPSYWGKWIDYQAFCSLVGIETDYGY
jgi:hypothetical protein